MLSVAGCLLATGLSEFLKTPNRSVCVRLRAIVSIVSILGLFTFAACTVERHASVFWLMWRVSWSFYLLRMVLDNSLNPEALKMQFTILACNRHRSGCVVAKYTSNFGRSMSRKMLEESNR